MNKTVLISAAAILVISLLFGAGTASAQSAFRSNFDHLSTGFPLDGSHRNVDCQRCHVGGIFRGTPRECSGCHARAGLVRATPMPPQHILSSSLCQDCHLDTTFAPVRRVDHTQVIGSCSGCHNGLIADGKPVDHPVTNAPCEDCHRSIAWLPAGFNHANVTGNCISCHNGMDATGKSMSHINTTNICEDCHRTVGWSPVIRVDHLQVLGTCFGCHNGSIARGKHPEHITSGNNCDDCHTTNAWSPAVFDHALVTAGTCSSCHNGMTATGKHGQHIQTIAECDVCHSRNAWVPANFDHGVITGACATCHNGQTATGKGQGHFQTARDCSYCHDTNRWVPLRFMHASANYPGDHARPLACTNCHGGNSEIVTWSAPAYQPDCAGCHAGNYKAGPHKKTESPPTNYTVGELRDCTGACHVYTNAAMNQISKSRPGPQHRVNNNGF
ncbi:MAG: cytochrome c3 family protein [Gammaproteobacteria bacterium]